MCDDNVSNKQKCSLLANNWFNSSIERSLILRVNSKEPGGGETRSEEGRGDVPFHTGGSV